MVLNLVTGRLVSEFAEDQISQISQIPNKDALAWHKAKIDSIDPMTKGIF